MIVLGDLPNDLRLRTRGSHILSLVPPISGLTRKDPSEFSYDSEDQISRVKLLVSGFSCCEPGKNPKRLSTHSLVSESFINKNRT